MTDNADAFSEFESPPTVDDPIIAQGGQNPADPFAEFDAPKQAVLREGPAPSLYESFKTNFTGMAGGLFEQGARTSDVLKAKSTISRADQGGVAGPGDVFSSKPTQLEVDKAIGDLAIWQADRDRYESFSSPTMAGKAAGFAGGLIGGALDPTMLIPISRVGEAYKGASTVAEVASHIGKTGLEFGTFAAVADTASQEMDIAAGYQDTFDKRRLLVATALGAGLGGGIGGMTMFIRSLRGELASQINRSVEETLGEPFSRPPMVEPDKIAAAPSDINAQVEFAPIDATLPEPAPQVQSDVQLDQIGQTGNYNEWDIKNRDGEHLGRVNVSYDENNKSLKIENIASGLWGEGKPAENSLGTSTVRSIFRELLNKYPDTESINGFRVSGAREARGNNAGGEVSFQVPAIERAIIASNPTVKAAQEASQIIRDIPSEQIRETIPAYDTVAQVIAEPQTEGAPAGIFMFRPTELNVDAKRFQFKEGGDEQGVTNALKSVTKWDQAKGNQVIVWQDLNGELFVVDGHQRSGLARRLIETGKEQDIQLPGLLYREADGISAEDARSIAAAKNIAEGSGSAIDGAKVLRSRPDLMDESLPLSAGKSRQAANLSKLGDEPFRMVINDVVPENYGAIVGERIPNDPARQEAAIKALARFEPRNENEAAVLVQRVAQAELEKAQEGAQGSMFGDLETAESTAGEEMRIVGKAIQELKKDKTLFSRVVANAERIEQTGSTIEREAASSITNESELFAKRLASDAYTPGPLREEIKAAAKDLRNGKITVGEATARIRSSLRGAAETDGGAGISNSQSRTIGAVATDDRVQVRTSEGLPGAASSGNDRLNEPRVGEQSERRLTASERKEKIAERKELIAQGNALLASSKTELVGSAATIFEAIGRKISELGFDLDRELNFSRIDTPEKRQSTLTPDTIGVIHQDYMRSKPIYMAISEAATGVRKNADTAVDKILLGKDRSVTPQELYDNFSSTRDALRAQYGDTIKLYRAEGKQKQKPTKNWATTREFAENFGDNISEVDTPIENIVAVNVGTKGNYHEIIATDPKAYGIDVNAKKIAFEPGVQGRDQALIPMGAAERAISEGAAAEERPVAVSGEYELRHGLNKQAAIKFKKSGSYEFVDNYQGQRYDGDGGIFGDAIYLDNTGIWTNDEGREIGRWAINTSVRVSFKPKNALLLSPDTLAAVRRKIGLGKEEVLTPEIITKYAKENKHDSLIVQGFDDLVGDAMDRYSEKYNVPSLPNNWETGADRIPWNKLDKADQDLLIRRAKQEYTLNPGWGSLEEHIERTKEYGGNLFNLADAEVYTNGKYIAEVAQGQVVVFDKSIVKVLGEAPKGEKFTGQSFEVTPASSERTLAGEQNLIPGVNPVTDADRIIVEQQRNLTGGNEPAGGMFDEGNTRQSELFLRGKRSGPQGPDADFRRRSNREQLPNSSETIIGPREGVSDAEARSFRRDTIMAQIAIDLGRQFKVDTRVTPGALGTYKPQQGVLRVRYSGDVEVFTHELGHAVDQLLANDPGARAAWNGLRSAQPSELAMLAPGQPIEEGVAEFTRLFITNPMAAAREAPMTTQAFQAILNVRPQIAKAISDAQALSKVESGLQPHQAFEAMIAPQSNGAIAKFSSEVKRQGFVPTVADYASVVYQQMIGRDQAFSRFANKLREARFDKTGKPLGLSFSSDPYTVFRRLPGAEQAAIGSIRDGVRPYGDITAKPVSPSLAGAIEKALGASISRLSNDNDPLVRGFNAYLIARRAKSLWERWETGDLRNQPVNASKNETLKTIEYYETANPNFKAGADDMFAFMRANFERQVDAGIIPKSVADKILARGDDYIPFFRDFEAEKGGRKGGNRGGAGIEYAPIMELRGSTRDILNPIKSAIESVSISERMIARNEVWKALDKWAEEAKEFSGQWWEIIPNNEIKASSIDIAEAIKANVRENGGSSTDAELAIRQLESMVGEDLSATIYKQEATTARGERVAFFWKNGERVAVKVGDNKISQDFFDLMTSMSEPERDIFIKAVSAANAMFQSMIVHAPRFALGTLVRDNITRMFTPRYMGLSGRLPGAQDVTGLLTLLFDQEFYKAWASGGATRGGIYTQAARELAGENPYLSVNGGKTFVGRSIDEWRSAGGAMMKGKVVLSTPAKFLSDATKLIESAETISRLGVAKKTFDYLKKHGLSDHEAMFGALHESKDVLPYERHGAGVTTLARVVTFLNAGIQGADRAMRGLVSEPVGTAITAYRRGGLKNLDANQRIALNNAAINWLYIGAVAGVGGTMYYNYAKNTDFYKNASEYLRDNYWLIETGKDKDGNPVGLTVHKPYDLPSVFINGIERYMHAVDNHLPNVAGQTFGAIQEAFPRQFHSAGDALGAFIIPKTAFELALNKKLGFAGKEPRDIVPERLKGLPPEMQQDALSSGISKKIGSVFGVSPKVVDHVIDSLGGTGGQDLKDISSAIFDDNPIKSPQDALNRAFFGQVYRTQRGAPGLKADLQDLIAQDHGAYALAANEYRKLLEEGQRDRAEKLYNRSDDATKAYLTMQTSSKFDTEMRQIHPLERSSKISSITYNMMRDLNLRQIAVEDRSQQRGEERKVIRVNDDQARKLMAQFNQLSIEETRNGLHIAKQPGYESFGILDSIASRLPIISEISPEAGKELKKRLKAAHILPAQGVAAVWPEAERRLLQDQGRARLHELVGKARRTTMLPAPETVQ